MYQYSAIDRQIVNERVEQFRDQVRRRLSGELSEEHFRPLRLQNGLYLQRHAYMLRVAIPYGLLSSTQVRMLAHIAREYDRGYGHFTTRQNIQYNWPELERVPDLLADLASVEMHAIQTSGNCVRNITADHLAGVAGDEIEDPRPWCEILRQWSTFHPEFAYLPRKFKIAMTGAQSDRAAVAFHDIGIRLVPDDRGEVGFRFLVGGGLGRTPMVGEVIRPWIAKEHLLSYTEAILRVYNLHGDRSNPYKARIKVLVKSLGVEAFREQVDAEFERIRDGGLAVTDEEVARVKAHFTAPPYDAAAASAPDDTDAQAAAHPAFARWLRRNVKAHRVPGYAVVFLSLKTADRAPGDATDAQLDAIADLADDVSFGEVRTTHDQNLVLADVPRGRLFEVWERALAIGVADPNIGTIQDLICCPGLDFCDLANAGSIGVAAAIRDRFEDLDFVYDLGDLKLKMSGCINACGHHHVGHIGILGINKAGAEFYQIMLGGSEADDASLGRWLGAAIAKDEVPDALERLLRRYVEIREGDDERLLDTYRRVGADPFKEAVYG
jgi:sulfite reductase (NADPH) hemoprotein beta-component